MPTCCCGCGTPKLGGTLKVGTFVLGYGYKKVEFNTLEFPICPKCRKQHHKIRASKWRDILICSLFALALSLPFHAFYQDEQKLFLILHILPCYLPCWWLERQRQQIVQVLLSVSKRCFNFRSSFFTARFRVLNQGLGSAQLTGHWPTGRVSVIGAAGPDIHLTMRQDNHIKPWSFWKFRIQRAQHRVLHFHFCESQAIPTLGPAFSRDQGRTWKWLGKELRHSPQHFEFRFGFRDKDILFCTSMPYMPDDWRRFTGPTLHQQSVDCFTLGYSAKGRGIPAMRLGQLNNQAKVKLILTARHHACEMSASHVLEGLVKYFLNSHSLSNLEILILPFVDIDGVMDGDQGKRRYPWDHHRDYIPTPLYQETQAVMDYIQQWSQQQAVIALDFHSPELNSQSIRQLGSADEIIWQEQQRFGHILASSSPIGFPYHQQDDIPWGQPGNTDSAGEVGTSFEVWAGQLPGMKLASTIEIPSCLVGDLPFDPARARQFGARLGISILEWLKTIPSIP